MATWVIFNAFKANVENGVHNLGSNTLKIALTNTAPSKTADGLLTDITQISAGNGYSAGGNTATVSSSTQTAGIYSLVIADVVFTASGGSFADFRYLVLYDDTATNDPLIACIDYGASYTLTNGNTFTAVSNPSGIFTNA